METLKFAIGRLLTATVTLLVVSALVFAGMHSVPGSYTDVVLPLDATPELRASLERDYGLDQPVPVQYIKWLGNVVTGDFGASLGSEYPVSQLVADRFAVTCELAVLSLLVTLLVGLPLALFAGMARRRTTREASRLGGALAMSTPAFVTGSLFLYLFSRYSLGLRPGKYVALTEDPIENLRVMFLPALTLSIFGVALIVRTGRDAVARVLSESHVVAALSRGETMPRIVRHHVLRNAAIPIVTVVAIFMGELMGGAVIVETLFTLPGLGRTALLAIGQRDYPVVQAIVLLAAATFITFNMVADLAYRVIDPRIRSAGNA